MEQQQEETKAADPPQQAESASLPLPYAVDAQGRKQPLPGSKSIFIRSGTVEAMGLAGLNAKTSQLIGVIPREKLLADIQFQGAISDFHPIKDALKAADYEDIIIRLNEDDLYGDGNNFEVATTQATAEAWRSADAAVAEAAAATAAAAQQGDAEGAAVPRSKRKREPQPWVDLGSEAELEAAGIYSKSSSSHHTPAAAGAGTAAARELKTGLLLSKPRRAFGAPLNLVDAPAADLWASNTMEARPFKDANYDLKRMQLEAAIQAVPSLQDAAVQAAAGIRRPGSTQTVPQQLSQDQLEQLIASPGFHTFLHAVQPRLDQALLQNAVADILADDLQLLGEEEGEGVGSSSRGPAGPAGTSGRQEHGGLTEAQSFTDLMYSNNKVVSAICWVPNRKGVVACSCTDPASQTDRLATMGRLAPAYILVWNFRDPIHPEYVLESPHEVFSFQYNPYNPDIVVGGCYNGQIVIWETESPEDMRPAVKQQGKTGRGGGGGWDDSTGEEAVTPVIRHKYLSAVEYSHTSSVADICWLPGLEIDRSGKVFTIRASSAGTSAYALLRSMTLGAAAKAAVEAGSTVPRECCFFASIAADGKVLFWDVRVDKLLKKGNKRMDETELVWRPMHTVHLLSVQGNDFAGTRFCFDPHRLDSGNFTAGSMDGELLTGNFIRPAGEENPDYTKCVFAPHVGPLVALQVSPYLPDVLLSVGDWSFKLWQGVEARTPVFTSPYADEAYTAAAWSPSRPGLLFLATAAGSLHIWDLLDRSHEPSLRINTASSAITSISFSNSPPKHATKGFFGMESGSIVGQTDAAADEGSGSAASSSGGAPLQQQQHGGKDAAAAGSAAAGAGLQVLAVGDATGMLHLFELPRTLRRPLPNERRLMAAFISREAARIGDVAARQPIRSAALKQQTDNKKSGDDTSSSQDQHTTTAAAADGGKDAALRINTISNSQAGTMAALPAATVPGRGVSGAGDRRTGGGGVAASAAELVEIEKAEKRYRAMETEFKQQLGLL